MPTITAYHRPASVEEALALLTRSAVESVIVAGGTVVNATPSSDGVEAVDIQSALHGEIENRDGWVFIGAMARLQDLVDHPAVPTLLRDLARREGPNTLRNAATVGGTIANADPDSELLAGLLVYETDVQIQRSDTSAAISLADLFADRSALLGGIITSVTVAGGGAAAAARTGRTPADTSIVSAVGRTSPEGLLLALTGVASTPVRIDRGSIESLSPPPDFRGSVEYRRNLAAVLAARVVEQLGATT